MGHEILDKVEIYSVNDYRKLTFPALKSPVGNPSYDLFNHIYLRGR